MTPELRTRILTAMLGAPLLLYLVYMGGAILFVAVTALSFAGLWELKTLLAKKGFLINAPFSVALGFVFLFSAYTGFSAEGGLVVFTILILAVFVQQTSSRGPAGVVNALIMPGVVYYSFGLPSFIISLRGLDSGRELTLLLLLVIWCVDTAAYFGGMLFGRKKLAPGLSPNKTVEGAATAIVAGITLGAVLAGILGLKVDIGWTWVPLGGLGVSAMAGALIGFTAAITGMLGDLVESAVKRFVGVKDSGYLIPGHGGVLDRFDSLFFAAPFVYFLWMLLGGRLPGPW